MLAMFVASIPVCIGCAPGGWSLNARTAERLPAAAQETLRFMFHGVRSADLEDADSRPTGSKWIPLEDVPYYRGIRLYNISVGWAAPMPDQIVYFVRSDAPGFWLAHSAATRV